eukprot:CAMPEP_0194403062 /NCGR_PEP_ID=MMETSP0176-20130528/1745_1 /TAXON_ID=216777 /ORGANISM="Proboscia alata, Strain PI-D3" /LENGTH=205 /DNA_ID=CAMNT_0039200735 /DNA_START=15 /DNA_END=632 /DNA_ORIENTATION=+
MTRQTDDVLSNNGQDYDIVEIESPGDTFPVSLYQPPTSLNICSMSTACAKGFNARFEVSTEDGRLALTALQVRTSGNVYPSIEGVAPVGQEISFNNGPSNILWADYVGMDVHMSQFSGRILLGADFMREVDSYGASLYRRVLEIHVTEGRVTNAIDRSKEVADRRKQTQETGLHCTYSWERDHYERELERRKQEGEEDEGNDDDL